MKSIGETASPTHVHAHGDQQQSALREGFGPEHRVEADDPHRQASRRRRRHPGDAGGGCALRRPSAGRRLHRARATCDSRQAAAGHRLRRPSSNAPPAREQHSGLRRDGTRAGRCVLSLFCPTHPPCLRRARVLLPPTPEAAFGGTTLPSARHTHTRVSTHPPPLHPAHPSTAMPHPQQRPPRTQGRVGNGLGEAALFFATDDGDAPLRSRIHLAQFPPARTPVETHH